MDDHDGCGGHETAGARGPLAKFLDELRRLDLIGAWNQGTQQPGMEIP